MLSWMASAERAQADVAAGVEYLQGSASPGGGYGRIPERDAETVFRALQSVGEVADPTGVQESWLLSAHPHSQDLQLRSALALMHLDSPADARVEALLDMQGTDGSFSFYPGAPGTVVETALGLQLMYDSGATDLNAANAAITWIKSHANADGSFGYEDNAGSIAVSVTVLQALQPWRTVYSLDTTLQGIVTWLFSQQQADGSFGLDGHPALNTAMALASTSEEPTMANTPAYLTGWTKAAEWLGAEQEPASTSSCSGSWECDPYTTAWAVLALASVRPDLTITSLTMESTSSPVMERDQVQIKVVVKNQGRAASASGALVAINLTNPTDSSNVLLGQSILSAILPGATQTLTLPWDTTGVNGDRYLNAAADTLNAIAESDETNNRTSTAVTIVPRVDLSIASGDLVYTPEDPGVAETVTFEARIVNSGGNAASNIPVQLILDPGVTDTLLVEKAVTLAPGASTVVSASTTLTLGSHTVKALIDPDNILDEGLESNNQTTVTIAMIPRIDLVLSSSQVFVSPDAVNEPDPLKVSITLYNQREDAASNVHVRARLYDSQTMTSIEQAAVAAPDAVIASIPGNTSYVQTLSISTANFANYEYLVIDVDPDNSIEETHEDNNRGMARVYITAQANLNVVASDLTVTTSATEGTAVSVKSNARNNGGAAASPAELQLVARGPNGETIDLGTQTAPSVAGGATITGQTVSWDTTGLATGTWSVTVILDPANKVSEKSESDNTVTKTLTLNPRADLSIVPADIAFSPSAPEEGDLTTLSATVRNLSTTTASGTFLVRFYDGNPASGGTQLGEVSRSSLSANTSFVASIPWDTTSKKGAHDIYVWVDPTLVISELNRNNNVNSKALNVAAASKPDFSVSSGDLSLSPSSGVAPGQTVQVTAVVKNLRNISASGVVARLYQGDPASGGTAIANASLNLPALGSATATFSWTTPSAAATSVSLFVVADADNLFVEPDETNNKGSILYRGRAGADTSPQNLVATVDYHDVSLTWQTPTNASTQTGYRLYRDGTLLNPLKDVTSGTTAAADSIYTASYPASNATDASTTTYWQSLSHAAPWWLELSFPADQLITRVDILWHASYRGKDYQIQGWDGTQWKTLLTVTGNTSNTVSHELTTYMVAKKVRVYVTAGLSTTYLAVYDMKVFGFDSLNTRTYLDPGLLSGTYSYTVTTVNNNGFESPDSTPALATILPPQAVSGLTALPDYTLVNLAWNASTERDMASYLVYRDGALLNVESKLAVGTLSADSVYSSTYTADKAADGNTSTYWFNVSHAAPYWWQESWSTPQLLSKVDVVWQPSYRGTDYQIQGWDGKQWVTLLSVVGNALDSRTHVLPRPYPTTGMRVNITKSVSTTYAGLYEVTAYGVAALKNPAWQEGYLLSGPYAFDVTVLNGLGEESAKSSVSATVPPPIPPSNLSAALSDNKADLSWPGVSNPTMASYLVYRDETLLFSATEQNTYGVASADSSYSSSYTPAMAVDTNTSSYWFSTSHAAPWWWQFDFTSARVVSRIGLVWQTSYRGVNYQIQGWDGKYWRVLADVVGNTTDTVTHTLKPMSTSRIRIYVTSSVSASYAGLYTVNIFGFAPYTGTTYSDASAPGGSHVYAVSVLNTLAEESAKRTSTQTVPYAAPSGLTASVSGDNVTLNWTASSGLNLQGYYLYRDGQLLNAPGNTNVALTAKAAASSTYSGYNVAALNDNSTSTLWYGNNPANGWTAEVNWTSAQRLSGVEIAWNASYYGIDYLLQAYDNGKWITMQEVVGNTAATPRHAFPSSVKTTGIRVLISRANNGYPGISELRALTPAPLAALTYQEFNVPAGTWTYAVTAVDAFGGESVPATASAVIGTLAPPTNLAGSATGMDVSLSWTASVSSGVNGYVVNRSGQRVNADVDVSRPGTATASSTLSASYPASNALDGNFTTYWYSATGSAWTWQVDWGTARKPDKLTLYWNASYRGVDYDIQSWDGSAWVTELQVRNNALTTVTHLLPNTLSNTRMRLNILKSSGTYVMLNEAVFAAPQLATGTTFSDKLVDNGTYRYTVQAVSNALTSAPSAPADVTVTDQTVPNTPTGFAVASNTSTSVNLKWNTSGDADLGTYRIYYPDANTLLTTQGPAVTAYTHSSVIQSGKTSYTWYLSSVDRNGLESAKAPLTWAPATPAAPTSFTAVVSGPDVVLTWAFATDPLRSAINVYRNGVLLTSQGPTITTFTDLRPARGTYAYYVVAKDLFGREGTPSATQTVIVNGTDLSLSDTDLFFLPQKPSTFDTVTLNAVVNNDGDETTAPIDVDFYDGDPALGGTLIGTAIAPTLKGGELAVVELTWDLTNEAGEHEIHAIVDPDNTLPEFYENNNEGQHALSVTAVPSIEVAIRDVDATAFPKVKLLFSAYDSTGQAVTDLTTRNLTLKEDDALQTITKLVLKASSSSTQPMVDVVTVIDTSGSMDDEFVQLPTILTELETQLMLRGVDVKQTNYSLAADKGDIWEPLYTGVYNGVVYNLDSEDWAPATAWASLYYPWRPGAVRIVVPVSDENCKSGSPEDATDIASLNEAVTDAVAQKVTVFPLWGLPTDTTVINEAETLGANTGGDAFPYTEANNIVEAIVLSVLTKIATYEAEYTTTNAARDGSVRDLNLKAVYRNAEGTGTGEYTAPSDNIAELVAVKVKIIPGNPLAGESATLEGTVSNQGSLPADVMVEVMMDDPNGAPVLKPISLAALAPAETRTFTREWLAIPGTHQLYMKVDPDNLIAETSESNNLASTKLTIPGTDAFELAVSAEEFSATPASPLEGDTVTLTANIHNLGLPVQNVLVQFYEGDPLNGKQVGADILLTSMASNSAEEVSVQWNSSAMDGSNGLTVVVDPLDRVEEMREDNNRAELAVSVTPRPVQLRITTDKSSYNPQSAVVISGEVESQDENAFTGAVSLSILDANGEVTTTLSDISPVKVGAATLADWRYYLPVTFDAARVHRAGTLAGASLNLKTLFATLGASGSFDANSIRVAEFDASGNRLSYPTATWYPQPGYDRVNNPVIRTLWQVMPSSQTTGSRYFRIYFDTDAVKAKPAQVSKLDTGALLVAGTEQGQVLYANRKADGTYPALTSLETLGVKVRVAAGDINGDARPDIVALDGNRDVYYYAAKSDGTFAAKVALSTLTSTATPVEVFVGDFDKDGDTDYLTIEQGYAPSFYRNNGALVFTSSLLATAPSTVYGGDIADLNMDGNLDLVVGVVNGIMSYYLGNGDGTFANPVQACDTAGVYPYGVAISDFDGDGNLDIVSNQGSAGNTYICRGGTTGLTFFAPTEIVSAKTTTYAAFEDLDFNGDGKRDLLAVTYTNPRTVLLFPGTGSATFTATSTLSTLTGDGLSAAVSGGLDFGGTAGSASLNPWPKTTFSTTWNTGTYAPASYSVRGILKENNDERSRAQAPFSIKGPEALTSSLVADRPEYGIGELVDLTAGLVNTSLNAQLEGVDATVSILGPDGTQVLSDLHTEETLTLQEAASWHVYYMLDAVPPGLYTAHLEATTDGGTTTLASTSFEVLDSSTYGLGLVGTLVADPDQLLPGDSLTLPWTVSNRGNGAFTNVAFRTLITNVDTETQVSVLTMDSMSLAVGETQSGSLPFDTDGLPLGSYRAVLQGQVNGSWTGLAFADFSLINLLATLTADPEEAEGGVDDVTLSYSLSSLATTSLKNVALTVEVRDSADVVVQTFSRPTANLEPGTPWTGSFIQPTTSLSLGDYTATLHIQQGSVSMTLAEAIFTVVDTIAPLSTLRWDGIEITQSNIHYMPSATQWILEATDNFSGVRNLYYADNNGSQQVYTGPFTLAEGVHTFAWQAEDLALNREPLQSVQAVVDDSPPVLTLTGVSPDECYIDQAQVSATVQDLSPTTTTMTLNGNAYAGQVIQGAGSYAVEAQSTDLLSHSSSASVQFRIETGACACQTGDATADQDGDGVKPCEGDCDDTRPDVNPNATESTDGVDNDCDGLIDEGLCPVDKDGDGFATSGGDCDDNNAARNPAAIELGDGKDNNCNGKVDEPGTDQADQDNDGVNRENGDCNDTNPATHPGAVELENDGQDNNCDGLVDETRVDCDADGDLYTELEGDCADGDGDIHPGAEDLCDSIDQDCDGVVKENCPVDTPTPDVTGTPGLTPTSTPGDTPTPGLTGTPGPTPTPDQTGTPGDTPTPDQTGTPGLTPTQTPDGSLTPTGTPGLTDTPVSTPTTFPNESLPPDIDITVTASPVPDDAGGCACQQPDPTSQRLPWGAWLMGLFGLGFFVRRRKI